MKDQNVLTKFELSLEYDGDDTTYISYCTKEVLKHLTMYNKIYSYLVLTSWHKNTFKELKVQYLVSQTDKYNTIDSLEAAAEIIQYIVPSRYNDHDIHYLCHRQPPLDLICELYEPLVQSLSTAAYNRWNKYFEYDDLSQTCYLTIIDLYDKGYYIHKSLIQRTYTNMIYLQLRKLRPFGTIQSLDVVINDDNDDEALTLLDSLEDATAQDAFDEVDNGTTDDKYTMQKGMVLGLISQRTYDQLVYAMEHNMGDQWAYNLIHNLKQKIEKRKQK